MIKDCSVIILAAGKSSRMGKPKFLLNMPDGGSFLENITRQYAEFGCSNIVVVLNNEGIALIKKHAQNLPSQTQTALNPHPEFGRYYSIKTGLKLVNNNNTFIHNVDNPYANKKVLEQIYDAKSEAEVIKPVNNGKGGHPVLISGKVRDYILQEKNHDINFKEFLKRFPAKKVEVKNDTVLLNINTYDEFVEFNGKLNNSGNTINMNIWNFIENKLFEEISLYLMVIIESNGSSPGKQGFSMAVSNDGGLFGSIGGGSMEFKLVENCRKMLQNKEKQIFIKKQIHQGNIADSSGMICSGEQTVAFIPLVTDDIANINLITSCLTDSKTGILEISQTGYNFKLTDDVSEIQHYCKIEDDNIWNYREIIGFRNTIYIIGAGHVGFAVSKLFSQLGFKIVLFDNRSNLSMLTDNPYADKKQVIDYKKIYEYISEGDNIYVIIMTNNHSYDTDVLSLLLRKKVKYLGMMGSKEKVAAVKKQMGNNGFTNNEMSHLHAPIGLAINSQTPDEIAVSIAAEIIKVKNSK